MLLRLFTALALIAFTGPSPAKTKLTRLTIVVRDHDNQPVDRAAVIVKPVKGKKVQGEYSLRTSLQGVAPLPPLRQGQFLVQVIAKGFRTHGDTYTIREPEKTINIQLQPPQAQFSVHK